jgi:cyclohexanecarboxylate-CoA ligase
VPPYHYDAAREREFVARGWWSERDTLTQWLARHARERAGDCAIASPSGALTWKALQERALRVAGGLARRGVKQGDVVAVQWPNTPEFLIAYLGISRIGALMCPLHMPYRAGEIETLLAHSGAVAAFCTPKNREWFRGLDLSFDELQREAPLAADHPEPAAADPYLLLYTSGTTAEPKGVMHAYRTMLGNGRLGAAEHGLSARDRILCAAPLSHLYGLYSLHCAWAVGAATVLLPAFTPAELAASVEKTNRARYGPRRRISPRAARPGSSTSTTGLR